MVWLKVNTRHEINRPVNKAMLYSPKLLKKESQSCPAPKSLSLKMKCTIYKRPWHIGGAWLVFTKHPFRREKGK